MRTHTEYECNLCFLKVIEMKEGMKETGVMLDHELHIPDSLQPLNTAISPVLKHPFFSFIGLLFVLFLAPSLPVVTDEHNARKIYKNIFLSVEQNSKFVHIQKEKKKTHCSCWLSEFEDSREALSGEEKWACSIMLW